MTATSDDIDLGNLGDLADGDKRVFEDIGNYGVLVCRVNGKLYAIEDNCSHADTPLSEGRLRGATVTCPLHGAQFDVRDGSHSGPPAWEGVASYPVTEEDGEAVLHFGSPNQGPDDPLYSDGPMRMR